MRRRPEKVRSVCLVIDSSASMELWDEVTRAWRRAIVGSGLFRTVRELRLDSDGDRPTVRPWSVRLCPPHDDAHLPKARSRDGQDKPPKLPLGSEPLVLIFTDACSRAWWNGSAFHPRCGMGTAGGLGPRRPPSRDDVASNRDEPLFFRFPGSTGGRGATVLPQPAGPGRQRGCHPGGVDPGGRSLATLALLLGENHREVKGGGLQIGAADFPAQGATPRPGSINAQDAPRPIPQVGLSRRRATGSPALPLQPAIAQGDEAHPRRCWPRRNLG